MTNTPALPDVSPTSLADLVDEDRVMDPGIRPLWSGMPRVTGPAYAVRCAPGDNLMMHAAIYRAEPGSVIVVDSGGTSLAVAGGNVCAVAQRRGIAGFVVDGSIRDLQEVREMGFPVFARGVFPKPGTKNYVVPSSETVVGGVRVGTGDVVVADEEGIVVVESGRAIELLDAAEQREEAEAGQSLDEWEAAHRRKIEAGLAAGGDTAGLPA
ncbi:RraA family protein [Zhihengliuella salsuginis]|uniref:Putative 4-hydroxy-4-methyl-2-oxoglutarate aldolase n=1 Tax=Zhihengliuella salsuginis TaxID=578222 RepID=A0ABQ3GJP0_9MICC|nr:RraA family protein [Zhihengliuella salsuginis]GHD11026.1 4-carboxy-4-hydroxy-2-oxoadipate aldolase [Zhihengliuella salsuginis]